MIGEQLDLHARILLWTELCSTPKFISPKPPCDRIWRQGGDSDGNPG